MQRNPVATSADDLWGWKESDDGVGQARKVCEVTPEEQKEKP